MPTPGPLRAPRYLVLAALAPFVLTASPQETPRSRFGLEQGREWIYVGSARWTADRSRVRSGEVQWVMQCQTVRVRGAVRAALVRGWVHDLAWYAPGHVPSFSVLIEDRDRLYVMAAKDSASAIASIGQILSVEPSDLPKHSIVIDSGLAPGQVYGGARDRGDRADALYAWQVEGAAGFSDLVPWRVFASAPSGWRLTYRTLPDHESLDFVPGVGITRYSYSHHGTVADTDVRLVAVRDARR